MTSIVVHHQIRKFWLVLFFSIIAILKFVAADQFSKWLVKTLLLEQSGYIMHLTSWLDLVYSWNYGISFGIFGEYHSYTNKVFIVINILISIYLYRQMFKVSNWGAYVGYSLIVGGAVGNLVDRVTHGAVFDFIYFHYNSFGFAAFNLADSFIFCGVMVILHSFWKESKAVAKVNEEQYDEFADEAERIKKLDAAVAQKGINGSMVK
jgi:signal peptidase II